MTQPAALYIQDAHTLQESMELSQYAESKGFDAVWQADSRLVRDAVVPMGRHRRGHVHDQGRQRRRGLLDPATRPVWPPRSPPSTTWPPAGSSWASAPGGTRWRRRSVCTGRGP